MGGQAKEDSHLVLLLLLNELKSDGFWTLKATHFVSASTLIRCTKSILPYYSSIGPYSPLVQLLGFSSRKSGCGGRELCEEVERMLPIHASEKINVGYDIRNLKDVTNT